MKKDSYIIFAVIMFFLFSVWAVSILDTEIDGLNKTVDYLLKVNTVQENRINNLEQYQSTQNVQIDDIRHANELQYDMLHNHYTMLTEYNTRFTDIIHEVNSFEEAVENLTPSRIALPTTWTGKCLSRTAGVVNGPSGRETYYNMDMSFCISRMRSKGYSEKDYPYWVRDDGCKMLGQYVMVAANFRIRPLGTILETSVGWAIVVDTGGFVRQYPKGIDVATTW